MRNLLRKALPFFLFISPSTTLAEDDSPTIQVKYLKPELAQKVVTTAVDECTKMGYKVAAAMVNRDGTLPAYLRNPLAGAHTEKVSQ